MEPLFLSWGAGADSTSWSESTLRRLVKEGVLSPPVRLGPGRVGFERERFVAEVRAYVARLNAAAPRASSPEAASA